MGYVKFKDPEAVISWPVFDEDFNQIDTHVGEPGATFEFEYSKMLGRFIVDFDPGPMMRVGHYEPQEFENTFDVVEE